MINSTLSEPRYDQIVHGIAASPRGRAHGG